MICFRPDRTLGGALFFVLAFHAAAQNQGLPNTPYSPEAIGNTVGTISSQYGFSQVAMHRGRLVAISAQDGGGGFAHILIIDISNPKSPKTVRDDNWAEANDIREAHGWGFRGDTIVLQAQSGIQFWDLSPGTSTKRLSYLKLPDIANNDYNNAIWWTHWQGRYLYAGGTDNGLYIVDALDPVNPVFVKKIPVNQLGGFRVGSTHAVGNLLYLSGFDNGPSGISIVDISDPVNPKLLSTVRQISSYGSMINGNKLVLGARNRPLGAAVVYDVSNPTKLTRIGRQQLNDSSGGGYVNFADGYAYIGGVGGVSKVDMNHPDFPVVAKLTAGQVDEGFPTPLGNLLFAGNDHNDYPGHGSGLIVHQAAPDTLGPSVNMVVPTNGATRQAITSRIGLTFTDQLEGQSLNRQNIVIREAGGDTVNGIIAHQTAIVNFHPKQLLKHNTTYEIIVRQGGVRDYAGNASPAPFHSTFTTGERSDCRMDGLPVSVVGDSVTFSLVCQNPVTSRISWDFGDGRTLSFQPGLNTVRHAYQIRGAYNVFARIEGELPGGAFTHHISLNPVLPVRSTRASTILLDETRQRLWNVNADNNSVTVSNAVSMTRIREIPVGRNPRTLALDALGRIWVANQDDASLSVIDGATFDVVHTISLPRNSRPYGIVFDPIGTTGYVTLEATGKLLKVNAAPPGVTDSLSLFPSPRGVAVSSDASRVFVSRYLSPREHGVVANVRTAPFDLLDLIGLAHDNSADTESGGSGVPNAVAAVAIAPDGLSAWVPFKKDNVRRGLLSSDPARASTPTFENIVRTAVGQINLATNVENPGTRIDLDNRSLANSVAFNRSGSLVFVTTAASNHTVVLSGVTGQNLTAIEPTSLTSELAPDGMALSPNDSSLFVHYHMSREIGVYDVSEAGRSNMLPRRAIIPTVETERLSPAVLKGKQVFYNASDPRMGKDRYLSCVVCHLDGGGTDGRVWDFTHKGEGLRRTPTLFGKGGLGHGPLHWSANFDEVQDFEHDMRNDFGGSGFISEDQYRQAGRDRPLAGAKAGLSLELDALSAFVTSLSQVRPSPYRQQNGELTADAKEGEILFHREDVGCAVCHAPPRYTNSGNFSLGKLAYSATPTFPDAFYGASGLTDEGFLLHDVGTLKATSGNRLKEDLHGLDTPTLLGIWEGDSYLHDGSAATLLDVMERHNTQDKHGRTKHLTPKEKEQLVAFMLQIDRGNVTPGVVNVKGGQKLALGTMSVVRGGDAIEFSWNAPLPGAVLVIHDMQGRKLASLKPLDPSMVVHTRFRWNGKNAAGGRVIPGIYYLQLNWNGTRHTQRVAL